MSAQNGYHPAVPLSENGSIIPQQCGPGSVWSRLRSKVSRKMVIYVVFGVVLCCVCMGIGRIHTKNESPKCQDKIVSAETNFFADSTDTEWVPKNCSAPLESPPTCSTSGGTSTGLVREKHSKCTGQWMYSCSCGGHRKDYSGQLTRLCFIHYKECQ